MMNFSWFLLPLQIFRKEPFFYGHDNHDQLVKIARVIVILYSSWQFCYSEPHFLTKSAQIHLYDQNIAVWYLS